MSPGESKAAELAKMKKRKEKVTVTTTSMIECYEKEGDCNPSPNSLFLQPPLLLTSILVMVKQLHFPNLSCNPSFYGKTPNPSPYPKCPRPWLAVPALEKMRPRGPEERLEPRRARMRRC